MTKLIARWETDNLQNLLSVEALCWKPYFNGFHDKLHGWAWKIDCKTKFRFRLHDFLVTRKWFQAWGRRKDIWDDSFIARPAQAIKEAIDQEIVERFTT